MTYFYNAVIGKSAKAPVNNFFFKQQQIVLKGDLKVRLNFHPNLFKSVVIKSEKLLMVLFLSSYLGVNPTGEKNIIFSI